jgi:hypothetical protein
VATETDAARDRVIVARADLEAELIGLEAAFRDAVDIPAKIKRSPVKVAAVLGGAGFVALKGPQRIFRVAKRTITGAPKPLPDAMLPDDIEKTLRLLGDDGDKVRGALERDFAGYVQRKSKERNNARNIYLFGLARPFLARGLRTGIDWLTGTDQVSIAERIAEVRDRAEKQLDELQSTRAAGRAKPGDAPEEPPTGV